MKNANIENPAGDPPHTNTPGTLPVSAGEPENAAAQKPAGRRIVIVTDTSGSMGGNAWYM